MRKSEVEGPKPSSNHLKKYGFEESDCLERGSDFEVKPAVIGKKACQTLLDRAGKRLGKPVAPRTAVGKEI